MFFLQKSAIINLLLVSSNSNGAPIYSEEWSNISSDHFTSCSKFTIIIPAGIIYH